MSQVNGSGAADERRSLVATGVDAVGLVASRLLEAGGFWSAVVLPFVAVGLLAVQPSGWEPLLVAVFVANAVAVLAGHCHGREC